MREIKNRAVQFMKDRIGQSITTTTVDVLNEYLEGIINEREFKERMKY